MAYQHIITEFKEGLGTLTFNRPPVNVLNIAMMEEINHALSAWQGEKDLKVCAVAFGVRNFADEAGVRSDFHSGTTWGKAPR